MSSAGPDAGRLFLRGQLELHHGGAHAGMALVGQDLTHLWRLKDALQKPQVEQAGIS